jgi:hypothetical protein
VVALRDDTVEGGLDGRARGDGLRRGQRGLRLGELRFRLDRRTVGVLDFLARRDAPLEQLARTRSGRARVVEDGLGAHDLGALLLDIGRRARDLEANQKVSLAHRVASGAGNFRDPRGLGGDDDEIRARRGIDDAGGVHDAADGAARPPARS